MKYDPIKSSLGNFFNRTIFLRRAFYRMLDLLLLRAWHVHAELGRFLSEHKKENNLVVLDAGSGFGQYSWYLAKKRPLWKVSGIEIKPEQVEDCNQFFERAGVANASFELADLTKFRKPSHFHLILSIDVMEHIQEDVTVFENFYASLKPGGRLLISTPSDQGGSGVDHAHDHSFIEEHVRDGYGKKEIEEKLNKGGFEKVDVKYTYGTPGKISWLFSMKYPIQMLGVSKWFFLLLPFYYLVVFPFCLLLNYADVKMPHKTGTGLLVSATKIKKNPKNS